jgi:hypothetical protein
MSAEADARCGAGHGERSADRINRRNGYREHRLDPRVGALEPAIPKLRQGSYSLSWPLGRAGGVRGHCWRWWPSALGVGCRPAGSRAVETSVF